MKVLHIWDQSGVACVITKYLRLYGVQSDIYKRKGFDKYKILEFYGHKEQSSIFGANGYTRNAINMAKKYDVIHVHDLFRMIPNLKEIGKKVILHYHGSILRNNKTRIGESYADRIFVSTVDLLDHCRDASYMPNPVDVEHFSIPSKTNYIMTVPELILYRDMPQYISKYGIYNDIKHDQKGNILPMSLLGLQCLSQGLSVIHNGITHKGLPKQHIPNNVVKLLMKTYNEMHNA